MHVQLVSGQIPKPPVTLSNEGPAALEVAQVLASGELFVDENSSCFGSTELNPLAV